ncbi:hypothetical protein [Micromonospora nigra]
MRLSDSEREVLFLAAGRRSIGGGASPAGATINPAVLRLVDRQPHPCLLIDSAFTVRAYNARAEDWFPWLKGDEPNLMRWAFTDPAARRQLERWDRDWAPGFLAQLRLAYMREPDNAALTQVIHDVMAASDLARWRWQNRPSVDDAGVSVRSVRVDGSGSPLKVEVVACSPLGCSAASMLMLVPVESPQRTGAAAASALGTPSSAAARGCLA